MMYGYRVYDKDNKCHLVIAHGASHAAGTVSFYERTAVHNLRVHDMYDTLIDDIESEVAHG